MKAARVRVLAKIALGLLTLFEIVSIYQMLFLAWLMTFLPDRASEWRIRYYVAVMASLVFGLLWIGLLTWILQKGRMKTPEGGQKLL